MHVYSKKVLIFAFALSFVFFAAGTLQYIGERWAKHYAHAIREGNFESTTINKFNHILSRLMIYSVSPTERIRLEAFMHRASRENIQGAALRLTTLARQNTTSDRDELHFDVGQTLLRLEPPDIPGAREQFTSCIRINPEHFPCKYSLETLYLFMTKEEKQGNEVSEQRSDLQQDKSNQRNEDTDRMSKEGQGRGKKREGL